MRHPNDLNPMIDDTPTPSYAVSSAVRGVGRLPWGYEKVRRFGPKEISEDYPEGADPDADPESGAAAGVAPLGA
jgi:hypothetical protein